MALIPGLATYGAYNIDKRLKKKKKGGKKNSLKKKKKGGKKTRNNQYGGFIRAPEPQHFYSDCNKTASINNNTWAYEPGS